MNLRNQLQRNTERNFRELTEKLDRGEKLTLEEQEVFKTSCTGICLLVLFEISDAFVKEDCCQ